MFEKIFVEKHIQEHPRTQQILERFKNITPTKIDKIEDVFGRVKKPYLQKRNNLNLFIGEKKGDLVKEAPDAYGLSGDPHYYFVHAYNCIYECEYCYLQGYFNSPDMVLFINHEDVAEEIKKFTASTPKEHTPWFHAGEYSDSLALSHMTGEIPFYFDLFKKLKGAKLEFRTKSANVKEILKQDPLPNVYTSFSVSPKERVKKTELKTPPLKTRLKAMKSLADAGHPIGLHFDPIIYEDQFLERYEELIHDIFLEVTPDQIHYISLGVVRFSKDSFHQVGQNYPDSDLLAQEFIKSFDQKVRYNRPMRLWILGKVKDLLINAGMKNERLYLCME